MRKTSTLSILMVIGGLGACSEAPVLPTDLESRPAFAAANAASTTNTQEAVDLTGFAFFNSCTGESVEIDGYIHVQTHITETSEGTQLSGHANLANLSGTGLDTGIKYRIVGRSARTIGQEILTPGGASVFHIQIHQAWIAQGPGNNLVLQAGVHLTVNANGQNVAFHDFSVPSTCQ